MAVARTDRRTRDDPEVRREKILDEAIRLVGERGFYGLTIQELAQRCGLTNGGVLYHFGSKEQLFIAMLEERNRRDRGFVVAIAGLPAIRDAKRDNSSLGAVLDVLRAIVTRCTEEPELTRLDLILMMESLNPAHAAHAYMRAHRARILDTYAKLLAPHAADPRAKARELLALSDGLLQQWFQAEQSFDVVAAWDDAVARLLPASDNAKPTRRRGK